MSLLKELEEEYKTYSDFEKVEQELIKKRNVFPINEIENRLKYRIEADIARDDKIDPLMKITNLAKNVYISSISSSVNGIIFKISNYFMRKHKEFNTSYAWEMIYTIRYSADRSNQGIFETYFNMVPSNHQEVATMVCGAEDSNKFKHGAYNIYRKSSTELESLSNFIENSGGDFSKNIIEILQVCEKRELLIHITQSHNLSKFQNNFKKLLIEMEEVLSVKNYENTFKAIDSGNEEDRKHIITVLQNLDKNFQTHQLSQAMKLNDTAKSKKIKI